MDRSVYEAVERSKERSRIYKRNRKRQILRRSLATVFSFCVAVIAAISCHTIISSAYTSDMPESYKYYTSIVVGYGDSLSSIAQEYADEHYTISEYISEVRQINHLKEDETIDAGSYLIVPYFSNEWK